MAVLLFLYYTLKRSIIYAEKDSFNMRSLLVTELQHIRQQSHANRTLPN